MESGEAVRWLDSNGEAVTPVGAAIAAKTASAANAAFLKWLNLLAPSADP